MIARLWAVLRIALPLSFVCETAFAAELPKDTVWYECHGGGVRIVGHTEYEANESTEPNQPPAIYAASESTNQLWWYASEERKLNLFSETSISRDMILGKQRLDSPGHWSMTGDFSIDRKTLASRSNGYVTYPDGDQQITHGTGTCKIIDPQPLMESQGPPPKEPSGGEN